MKRRIQYVVSLQYNAFVFDNGEEALAFATEAAQSADNANTNIEIELRYWTELEV